MGERGFEPLKAEPTGLQPVPFGHSGTPPGVGHCSPGGLLLGPEWVSQSGGLSGDESFRRGQASLYVSTTDEATSFGVDHNRYDR